MKQKKLLVSLLAFLVSMTVYAQDDSFVCDEIYYIVTSADNRTVEVVQSGDEPYSGSISIPSTVTYLGQTYTVTSIGDWTFCGNSGLTSVTIPNSVTSIGEGVFDSCENLTSIIIPEGVTSIGNSAFGFCSSLTSVTIPNSVTSIGEYAFTCSGLTSVTIPNSVTTIGVEVFSGCSNLTSIIIPKGVTSIREGAFSYCTSLTSVVIPNSVTSIGEYAFGECTGLTDVYCYAEMRPYTDSYAFYDSSIGSATLHVPAVSVEAYSTTNPWCDFGTIVAASPIIIFADANVKAVCVANWDTSGDGELSVEEAAAVTDLGTLFKGNIQICSFEELQYFTGLTSIANNAFNACTGLTSISFPNSVISIGTYAFYGCSGLSSITIPSKISSIGNNAFESCTGLISVVIGNSVTSIGDFAFFDCSSLTTVIVGNNLETMGEGAFGDCSGLIDFYCYAENVPATGINLFSNSSISSATLHVLAGSVEAYKTDPWNNFGRIVTFRTDTINFADVNVKTLCVANWDTNSDGNLSEDEAAAVTDLGEVFKGNYTIISFNELQHFTGLTSIGDYAFQHCSTLTSIIIPEGVTSIADYAFQYCTALTSIIIPEGVTSIGEGAFFLTALTSIIIPEGVTSIGDYAFSNCRNLTSISIPEGVTSIGDYAFSNCRNLTSISIPEGVTSIGDYAFSNCRNLTSISIPEGVTSIGESAFADCSSLTSITIPESVTSIGENAFANCSSLTSITIPESVTSIGESAFADCSSLTSITIPEGVTSICAYAFSNCKNLTSIIIPEGVTSIDEGAFSGCRGLTSVTIPNSVTSIGMYAFSYCNNLTDVYCYTENVPNAANNVFDNSNVGSARLHVPTSALDSYRMTAPWSDFRKIIPLEEDLSPIIAFADAEVKALCVANWDINDDGELSEYEAAVVIDLCGPDGFGIFAESSITSFDEFQYFTGLTSICEWAFSCCENLTSITIPESVTSIGWYAFSECRKLTSIIIPEGVTSICSSAFEGCERLTSITIPEGVTSIGECTFWRCASLTSVIIPNNVTSIEDNAFSECYSLTSIIIPAGVTSIGYSVFSFCNGLESLKVQEGNTVYDSRNNCNAIIETSTNTLIVGCKNTVIPKNVTSIGSSAFFGCEQLTSITIPESVTSIDDYAFGGCIGLTNVYCYAEEVPNTGRFVFDSSNISSATLHVPAGSIEAYRTTAPWSDFGMIVTNSPNIIFADANVKAVCVANWDIYGDGDLSEEEAAAVTDLGTVFRDNTLIKTFEELQYFTALTAISDSAFFNCKNLASVTLPESVTSIGVRAFCSCSNSLTTIAIPSSVTSIGDYAFQNCYKLSSVIIPENVTKFGNYVFYNCNGLESLEVQEGNTVYDSRNNCNAIIKTSTNTLIVGCKNTVIPEDVTAIGDYAFRKATGLVSITIPQSVTSIGKNALSACTGLTDVWCYARKVPSTKSNTFDGSSIGSATLHVPTPSICAYSAATPWSGFGTIVGIEPNIIDFADANVKAVCVANWDTDSDGELNEDEAAVVTDLGSVFKNNIQIKLFDELQYFVELTAIPDSAFFNCKNLASVTLPESVTSIGVRAFCSCSNRLTTVAIPSSVTSIGDYAFQNCYKFSSIVIPKNVTKFGNYVFYNCNGLTSLEVQAGNTVYDSRNNCNAIIKTSTNTLIVGCKNTVIPEDVTTIGDYAFRKATGLVSITIPQSVTSIGKNGFSACTGLTDVWCYAENIPNTKNSVFDGTPIGSATLRVPATSFEAYCTTEPWSGFGTIVTVDGSNLDNTIAAKDIVGRNGQQVELPIELTNEGDLTIVGISFTLTLPEGVTVATDENNEPIYSLERLNPSSFSVISAKQPNGSWGFRITTTSATASLKEMEGAFITLTLNISNDMKEGSYGIRLNGNSLSLRGSDNLVRTKVLGNTTSILTVANANLDDGKGDVNDDGFVDICDAIMVIYYSLNMAPAHFNEAVADMNNDNKIDLSDAITIIYKSLGVQLGNNARRKSKGKAAANTSDYLQLGGDGNNFGMSLSNEGSYVGFQCDIKLPTGATLTSIDLNESRAAGHTLMYNRLDDSSYRVVAFSMKGDSFFGNQGDLLLFTIEGTEQGEVSIENIFFVDSDLNKVAFDDLTTIATGIAATLADTDSTPVYNLAGQQINSKSSNRKLPKGIYISKNRKTVR